MRTEPPSIAEDEPTNTDTLPLEPSELSPEEMTRSPEASSPLDSPVRNEIEPLLVSPRAVSIVTSPLSALSLVPLCTETEPPRASVLRPARIMTDPPSVVEEVPTSSTTSPAEAFKESPVDSVIEPVLSSSLRPVVKDIEPLKPF